MLWKVAVLVLGGECKMMINMVMIVMKMVVVSTPGQSAGVWNKTPMQIEILLADLTNHDIFSCIKRIIVGYNLHA